MLSDNNVRISYEQNGSLLAVWNYPRTMKDGTHVIGGTTSARVSNSGSDGKKPERKDVVVDVPAVQIEIKTK